MGLSWGDLNPLSWPGQVKRRLQHDGEALTADSPEEAERKRLLNAQAGAAGSFADQAQAGYGQLTNEAAAERDYLRRLARGQDSMSAEQLRQGTQALVAGQRSAAAGAAPQNAAMAARTAAIQAGRIGSGMAGQQAMAGIAERQAAHKGLADMIMGQRGQDVNATLGSRQTAITGYGGIPTEKSDLEKYAPTVIGLGSLLSDERLKEDIEDGDEDANAAMKGLRAYTYKYRDQAHGKGKQVGIMAQDLERAGLKHAVVDTPIGKAVHGGKLAGANTAMLAALERRVAKMERRK